MNCREIEGSWEIFHSLRVVGWQSMECYFFHVVVHLMFVLAKKRGRELVPWIVLFSPKNILCHMSEVLRLRLQEQRLQAATGSSDDQTLILSARWLTLLVCCIGVPCNSAVWWMMVWSVIYISVFLNITSVSQCKKTGWKWQLESNQLYKQRCSEAGDYSSSWYWRETCFLKHPSISWKCVSN